MLIILLYFRLSFNFYASLHRRPPSSLHNLCIKFIVNASANNLKYFLCVHEQNEKSLILSLWNGNRTTTHNRIYSHTYDVHTSHRFIINMIWICAARCYWILRGRRTVPNMSRTVIQFNALSALTDTFEHISVSIQRCIALRSITWQREMELTCHRQ